MKLIDILNKIANGELKEGTKVELGNKTYAWDNIECCLYNENEYFMCLDPMKCLNDEVELIEPDHFADDGKMAEHIREDTKMIEPTDNTKIEELDGYELTTLSLFYKINEIIRYINKED